MYKVQKHDSSEFYAPSSEPFTFYKNKHGRYNSSFSYNKNKQRK
jgi:hypothetical protein